MPTENIDYTDKTTGDNFTAADANEIKSAVNQNAGKTYGAYLSQTVGTLPDSAGAVANETIGAYYPNSSTFQKVIWDGSEWQTYGESIPTKKYVNDKDALLPVPGSGFIIRNAAWSWWTKPCILRHRTEDHDKTFMAVSGLGGELAVAMYDHRKSQVSIQRLSNNFLQDDHNTGAIVVDDDNLVAFFPGRASLSDDTKLYYYTFDGLDIHTASEIKSFNDTNRVDYPNAYNYNGSLLVFYRRSGSLWGVRTFSWPSLDSPSAVYNFLQTEYSQMYVASRRNRSTRSRIDIAIGHHPETENHADLYVGFFDGATDPQWNIKNFSGTVLGNAFTGASLPLGESDFTKVYTANMGERTRLFDVIEGAVAFATYPDGNNASGSYKISRYNGASWDVYVVESTGKPFYNPSAYYGGIAFDDKDKDTIYVSREVGDEDATWVVDEYKFNGTSYSFANRLDGPSSEVKVRPMTASLSDESGEGSELPYWSKGQYDYTDYEKWALNIVSSPVQAQAESPGETTLGEVVRTGTVLAGASEIIIPIDINGTYSFSELLISGISLQTANSDDLRMQLLDSNKDPIGVGAAGAGGYAYRSERAQTSQDATVLNREENVDHAIVGRMQTEPGFIKVKVQINGIQNRMAIKVDQNIVSSGATGINVDSIVSIESNSLSGAVSRYIRFYTTNNENFKRLYWSIRKKIFVNPPQS